MKLIALPFFLKTLNAVHLDYEFIMDSLGSGNCIWRKLNDKIIVALKNNYVLVWLVYMIFVDNN